MVEELDWVPGITSTNIGVSVTEGTVTLSGETESYHEKVMALAATQRERGVTAVAQEITVADRNLDHLNDTDVARTAGDALQRAIDVPETIKASVHDQVITLSGDGFQHQRKAAVRAVRDLDGVRDVVDEIRLRSSEPVIAAEITASIHQAFVRNAIVDHTNVRVTCDPDGAVFLDGTVGSWSERRQAEGAVWGASGVTSVTDRLRVTI